jgi:hypothetical protein
LDLIHKETSREMLLEYCLLFRKNPKGFGLSGEACRSPSFTLVRATARVSAKAATLRGWTAGQICTSEKTRQSESEARALHIREEEQYGSNEIAQSKQQPCHTDGVFRQHAAWSFVKYDPERKYRPTPRKD